jgi:nicotinamide-nucleotide amidase
VNCEIVAVGTELLLGQIVDTNSSWMGEQLALHGIDCHHQTRVGDNLGRVVDTLRRALERADVVICCGGLGPTQDDLTRDAIAELLGVPLLHDERIAQRIRTMFAERGRPMPDNNLRQAEVPLGCHTIAQQPGTAPGLVCPTPDGKVIYAVPGVPYEMQQMLLGTVLPELVERSGRRSVILSRTLRTWGQSESGIAEVLADRIIELDEIGNPTLAFLASGIEGIKVRITAKADDEVGARALLAAEEAVVRDLLGPIVFGVDDTTMEAAVLGLCAAAGLTLGTAESLTGGMIASRLCAVPGASATFRGSVVSYATDVKQQVLGVPDGPVVTEAAAAAMAQGAQRVLGVDVALATTGVAGPTEQEGVPVGTVCLAVAIGDDVTTRTVRLPGDRERIRQFATITVLDALRLQLLEQHAVG